MHFAFCLHPLHVVPIHKTDLFTSFFFLKFYRRDDISESGKY